MIEATNSAHLTSEPENSSSLETGWIQVTWRGKRRESLPKSRRTLLKPPPPPGQEDPGVTTSSIISSITNITSSERNNTQQKKKTQQELSAEPMETAFNLKRWDSGEGHAKWLCPNTPPLQTSSKGKIFPNINNLSIKKPPIKNGTNNPPSKNNPNNSPVKNSSPSKFPTPSKSTPLKPKVRPFILLHSPLSTWTHITPSSKDSIRNMDDTQRLWKPAKSQIGLVGRKQGSFPDSSGLVLYKNGSHCWLPAMQKA